jgi:hypothetical protein
MPEFTLTTSQTDEIEIIHLFKSQELKDKFINNSIDKQIDLDQTVKEVRQTKDINRSIGVHLHLIF